jgi:sulfoxide reductase heme-binding subunit YedZ
MRPPAERSFGATLALLWTDRAGRVSALKLIALVAILVPACWLALSWHEGWLGARPRTALIHQSGLMAVRLLLASLAISPGRAVLGWARLMLVRRMLGVAAGGYALAHLGLYAMQQNFHLLHVGSEIIHRIYLLIGLTALLGLAALSATSTDAMIRRLGGHSWKHLHRWAYGIGVLGLLHFFMQSKSDVTQAVIMAGLFAWLMLWRASPARWRAQLWFLLLLVPAAAVSTAGIEAGWYAAATHLPWPRVLAANWSFNWNFGPRPSAWVGMAALTVVALAAGRQGFARLWLSRSPAARSATARAQPPAPDSHVAPPSTSG